MIPYAKSLALVHNFERAINITFFFWPFLDMKYIFTSGPCDYSCSKLKLKLMLVFYSLLYLDSSGNQ